MEGKAFVVGATEEGGKFYHDRVYTMKEIPKQYLGLTNITASADTIGDLDVQWTFKINLSAYVYIGFDERWDPPEDRKQNPNSNSIKFLHLDSLISVFIKCMPDYESTILLHNLQPNAIKSNYVDEDNLVGRILPTP